ncbi:MAG: ABC transporter permease [Actinomycetaceae bacterium]|nr:ABC transporter permease [Actinomycetaceae bacterium]
MTLTRLIVAGNRAARFRLAAIAVGIMIGVALFLLLFGAYNSFPVRSERSSAITNCESYCRPVTAEDPQLQPGEILVASAVDHYRGNAVIVQYVAGSDSSVKLAGVDSLPSPGTYVASQAFQSLAAKAGSGELEGRYGRSAGTVSADGLEGPDSLAVVVGVDAESLLASGMDVYATATLVGNAFQSQAYRVVALFGAMATLIPVLMFVAIVTELGAAQRADSYATLRLIGASPRKLASLAAMETAVTASVGGVLGVGLYFLALPLAANVRMGMSSFYRDDLLVSPVVLLAVVVATVVASVGVSWWKARRTGVGPVGSTRERREKATRWISAVPLLCGLVLLGGNLVLPASMRETLLVGGLVMSAAGIVVIGPHLTLLAVRAVRPFARNASQVMALNRLARHPRSSFRSISGIIVALYLVTVFAVGITVAPGIADVTDDERHLSSSDILVTYLGSNDPAMVSWASQRLAELPGVEAVAQGSRGESDDPNAASIVTLSRSDAIDIGLNPPGRGEYVTMPEVYFTDRALELREAVVGPGETNVLFTVTDGRAETIERTRTAIMSSGLHVSTLPVTRAENAGTSALDTRNQFAAVGYTAIGIVTGLSAISFAVSTFSSLLDRRRVLGLLRLSGMPRRTLRAMFTIETALPMACAFLLSIGLGALTAWALVSGLSDDSVGWPDAGYFGVLMLSLMAVVGAVVVSLRSYPRLTDPTQVRFE